eukprot:599408-Hanusia_phi.AAC.1
MSDDHRIESADCCSAGATCNTVTESSALSCLNLMVYLPKFLAYPLTLSTLFRWTAPGSP